MVQLAWENEQARIPPEFQSNNPPGSHFGGAASWVQQNNRANPPAMQQPGRHSKPYTGKHGLPYNPKQDINAALSTTPTVKKGGKTIQASKVAYTPRHSTRSFTPVQQMRAKLAAAQGTTYNPVANPPGKVPLLPGLTISGPGGIRKTAPLPAQKQAAKTVQPKGNLNRHQFKLKAFRSQHHGKNAQILANLAGKKP